jgi:hypothetical protein
MRESHERRARANLERSVARLKPNLRRACDVAMAVVGIALIVVLPAFVGVELALAAAAAVCLLYFGIRPRL